MTALTTTQQARGAAAAIAAEALAKIDSPTTDTYESTNTSAESYRSDSYTAWTVEDITALADWILGDKDETTRFRDSGSLDGLSDWATDQSITCVHDNEGDIWVRVGPDSWDCITAAGQHFTAAELIADHAPITPITEES